MIDVVFYFLIGIFIGIIIGYHRRGPGWEESQQYYEKYRNEIRQHQKDIEYYKKLCKTLADENAEFRRNQK